MSKEKSPAYQHYPNDYLADINTQIMTLEEEGMYRRLMDHCWKEITLPESIEDLTALCKGVKPTSRVLKCFVKVDSGYRHKRLDDERAKQEEWRKKSAKGGRASAHKRKHKKELNTEQCGTDLVLTKRQPKVNSSSSSSSSSSNNKNVLSEHSIFKKFFDEEYIRIREVKMISDRTDWIALENLMKKINGDLSEIDIKKLWTKYLLSPDPFHQKQGHPLRWFANNVNAFMGNKVSRKTREEDFWTKIEKEVEKNDESGGDKVC